MKKIIVTEKRVRRQAHHRLGDQWGVRDDGKERLRMTLWFLTWVTRMQVPFTGC